MDKNIRVVRGYVMTFSSGSVICQDRKWFICWGEIVVDLVLFTLFVGLLGVWLVGI